MAKIRKITGEMIECAAGVQVEYALPGNWTLYSPVYKSEDHAREAINTLALGLGVATTTKPLTPPPPRTTNDPDNEP